MKKKPSCVGWTDGSDVIVPDITLDDYLVEANSRSEKLKNKKHLNCSFCPPNRGENATRQPKHGVKKPKHKDHR